MILKKIASNDILAIFLFIRLILPAFLNCLSDIMDLDKNRT